MKHYQTYIRFTNETKTIKRRYTRSGNWHKAHRGKDYTEKGSQIHALRQEGKTLQEIGDIFGVTRERIRQIYNLYKIRNPHLRLPIKKESREVLCNECGRKMMRSTNQFSFYREQKCHTCINYEKYQLHNKKTDHAHFRRHKRSPYCLVCQKPFTSEFPYFNSNRCNKCFYTEVQKKSTGDVRRAEWLGYFYRGEAYPYKHITF